MRVICGEGLGLVGRHRGGKRRDVAAEVAREFALWEQEELARPEVTAEVAGLVRLEVFRRWPKGVIPATEGGRFFRDLSDRYGCVEAQFSLQGAREGWWPWSVEDVIDAFARKERIERRVRRQREI